METIPKERLRIIGIQDDISLAIKPNSIAAYGSGASAAAVIMYLFLHILRMFPDITDVLGKIGHRGAG
jgi:hypothetical protein